MTNNHTKCVCSSNSCSKCIGPSKNRYYGSKNYCFRTDLAKASISKDISPMMVINMNSQNCYKFYSKGFKHNQYGNVIDMDNYKKLWKSLMKNDQQLFNTIVLAGTQAKPAKLVDPFASIMNPTMGLAFSSYNMPPAPEVSSKMAAAEMVQLYAAMLARDIPFKQYNNSNTDLQTIISYMNIPDLLREYVYHNISFPIDTPITPDTFLRGPWEGCYDGPYISQLMYLNVPSGAQVKSQKIYAYPTKAEALQQSNYAVDWGYNKEQLVQIQNMDLTDLKRIPNSGELQYRYIYSGRALAEMVHNDESYQFYYDAVNILNALKAPVNPTFPLSHNINQFITGSGRCSTHTLVAEAADMAICAGWYIKWMRDRKLRPEAFSILVDNVKRGQISNNNYNISNLLLDNPIFGSDTKPNSVLNSNYQYGSSNSYVMNQAFQEGSPAHPSYPSGHACIAGACVAILRMIYDIDKKWCELIGVKSGPSRVMPISTLTGIVQANDDGTNLEQYGINASDANIQSITVGGELTKLAYNAAVGREWAGIHYCSDAVEGILLGEQVAINVMKDKLSAWIQNNQNGSISKITYKKLDGTVIEIMPRL